MDIRKRFDENLSKWEESFSSKDFNNIDDVIKELLIDSMVLYHNNEKTYVEKIKDLSVEERHFMIERMINFLKKENTNTERRKLEKEEPSLDKFKVFVGYLNIYNAVLEIITMIFEVGEDFPEKLLWDISYFQTEKVNLERYLRYKSRSENIYSQLLLSSINEIKTKYVEIIPPDNWYEFAASLTH